MTQGHCLNPQLNKSGSHEDVHLFFFIVLTSANIPPELKGGVF